jgi:hypothetical protein
MKEKVKIYNTQSLIEVNITMNNFFKSEMSSLIVTKKRLSFLSSSNDVIEPIMKLAKNNACDMINGNTKLLGMSYTDIKLNASILNVPQKPIKYKTPHINRYVNNSVVIGIDLIISFIFCRVVLFVAKLTANELQLQVRGGIRSRNVSTCTGVEHEANTCKFALHPP